MVMRVELDAIDMKILRELQNDGRMTNVELAERVNADTHTGDALDRLDFSRLALGADIGIDRHRIRGRLCGLYFPTQRLGRGLDHHRRQRRRLLGRHIAARRHGSGILRCRRRGHSKAHRGATQRHVRKLGHGNTPQYAVRGSVISVEIQRTTKFTLAELSRRPSVT